MAGYLYKHDILLNSTDVYGFNTGTEASDKSDFETNFKATAVAISGIEVGESLFVTEKTYAQFKAFVASPITWADVRYIEDSKFYHLYLLSDNPL